MAHRLPALLVASAIVALASGLSLAMAAASSGSSAPLVIAVEGPQSGAQAANGVDQLRGVRLAVNQLNARGGLWDGRKVAVFAADDQADAANAKAVARQVIAKRIGFVIGPYNSSVGIENLPLYRRAKVLPLWMTSRDETAGVGATVQPMNTQIAPIEQRYVKGLGARRVAMLVDDTPNGAFTKGMAERLQAALERDGASVTWTSVLEATDPGATASYYADRVADALKSNPDLVYVSTYFPAGIQIAKALTASGSSPQCPMGLANVDNACGGAAVRLQRRAGGHRDAVRQDVRASVRRDVQQDSWGLGLVYLRLRQDSLRSDRPGQEPRLRSRRASAPSDQELPRHHRHDHDRPQDRLPDERPRQHPSGRQPETVRNRKVALVSASRQTRTACSGDRHVCHR